MRQHDLTSGKLFHICWN